MCFNNRVFREFILLIRQNKKRVTELKLKANHRVKNVDHYQASPVNFNTNVRTSDLFSTSKCLQSDNSHNTAQSGNSLPPNHVSADKCL